MGLGEAGGGVGGDLWQRAHFVRVDVQAAMHGDGGGVGRQRVDMRFGLWLVRCAGERLASA